MKLFLLFSLIFVYIQYSIAASRNGKYVASIYLKTGEETKRIGFGAIIDRYYILTTAHNFWYRNYQFKENDYIVKIREANDGAARTYGVRKIIPNNRFDPYNYGDDVALIRLDNPIEFNCDIGIIKLSKCNDRLPSKGKVIALADDAQNTLIENKIEVVGTKITAKFNAPKKTFFGLSKNPKQCIPDNGSLFVVKDKLFGLLSASPSCHGDAFPDSYVDLSKYVKWIENIISI